MTERYFLRPDPAGEGAWQVIDSCSTNGYGEPWVEVPGLPYALARANCWRLNATWEAKLPPCTCPEKETNA
jgi:hypothetical protein